MRFIKLSTMELSVTHRPRQWLHFILLRSSPSSFTLRIHFNDTTYHHCSCVRTVPHHIHSTPSGHSTCILAISCTPYSASLPPSYSDMRIIRRGRLPVRETRPYFIHNYRCSYLVNSSSNIGVRLCVYLIPLRSARCDKVLLGFVWCVPSYAGRISVRFISTCRLPVPGALNPGILWLCRGVSYLRMLPFTAEPKGKSCMTRRLPSTPRTRAQG